jgi:hypothetical protein
LWFVRRGPDRAAAQAGILRNRIGRRRLDDHAAPLFGAAGRHARPAAPARAGSRRGGNHQRAAGAQPRRGRAGDDRPQPRGAAASWSVSPTKRRKGCGSI